MTKEMIVHASQRRPFQGTGSAVLVGLTLFLTLFFTFMTGQSHGAEPANNTPAGAETLVLGTPFSTETISPANEVDYFKFTVATANILYTIVTTAAILPTDPQIILYDTDTATVLGQNDNCTAPNSCINWIAPKTGTFYVKVISATGTTGAYTLTVTAGAAPAADDHLNVFAGSRLVPLGQATVTAISGVSVVTTAAAHGFAVTDRVMITGIVGTGNIALLNGTVQTISAVTATTFTIPATTGTYISGGVVQAAGAISAVGDIDYFRFTVATAGRNYTIATANLASSMDTVIALYDTTGLAILLQNDDCGSLASCINWISIAGTYGVSVRHYNSAATTGSYSLTVTEAAAPVADDHANTIPGTTLTLGTPTAGAIGVAGDVDYFSFTGVATNLISITTSGLSSGMDTVITLSGPTTETFIAENDDCAGSGLSSCISRVTSVATYFVKVRHYNSRGTGTYTITATNTGAGPAADDHVNVFTGSRTIPSGQATVTGITIANPGVVSAANTFVAADRVMITGIAAGTLATALNGVVQAPTAFTAGTITIGSTLGLSAWVSGGVVNAAGTINPGGDVDYFRFPTVATTSYTIYTTAGNTVRMDTVLTLYDTDGVTVLTTNDDCGQNATAVAFGGGGLYSCITFTAATVGPYHVKVNHYNSNSTGDYGILRSP